jgi:hypothetical protein
VHGEQHRRFESVHVLCRHGADNRVPRPVKQAKPAGFGPRIADERPPGLVVRHRQAGRSRGIDGDRDQFPGDVRNAGHGLEPERRQVGKVDTRQVEAVEGAVAEAEDIRMLALDLAQRFDRLRRRLQAGAPVEQAGRQADAEAIAVLTEIEEVASRRQALGQRRRRGEEAAYRRRTLWQVGEDVVEAGVPEQRHAAHRSLAREPRWRIVSR